MAPAGRIQEHRKNQGHPSTLKRDPEDVAAGEGILLFVGPSDPRRGDPSLPQFLCVAEGGANPAPDAGIPAQGDVLSPPVL